MRVDRYLKLLIAVSVLFLFLALSRAVAAKEIEISDYFSREEIETAARFNNKLYTLFIVKQAVLISFLGLAAFSRLAASYKRDAEKLCFGKRRLVLPVYAFFVVLMIRLVLLPFDAVRDLVIKGAFGLTVQGAGGWLADQVKSFFVADIWYVPFVVLVYMLMRRFWRSWWLISAGAVGLATITWYSLAPHLVEPLFYRITPVRSEALRSHLDPLLQKAGLDSAVLYEADSGKKTKEVNAYLSGLFLGRRIVLYDVLAEDADPSELEFVVAHEIAHWKKNHTVKGIALGTVGAAGVFVLLGVLLKLTAGKKRQGDGGGYAPESLPIFFFWLNVILLLIMPVECAVSRRFEKRADAHALELTQHPDGAVRLFQKVARKNLSDLTPPALARLWVYTHPPILERIEAALKQATKPDGTISRPEAPAPPEKPATIPEADKPGPEIGTTHENDDSEKGERRDGESD